MVSSESTHGIEERGELYRSTVWRSRLDATTNWAVVSTGLALSLTFSSEWASPLPLVLVGLLVAVFLSIEARRYRFFDFWRVRAHILETQFFGPILLARRSAAGGAIATLVLVTGLAPFAIGALRQTPKPDIGAPAIAARMQPGIWLIDGRAGGEGAVIAEATYADGGRHAIWAFSSL